ncbi:MAG: tetratricopeptide repeat protein [Chloroflexi bacterium]|nr:tetratricopeptide repeat protein [Chloroflexota bacterium]
MKGALRQNYNTMINFRLLYKRPVFVFALTVLAAYGLLAAHTGFYWDDWPFAWSARFLGPADFNPSFAPFRPFLGPIFYLTTSLVPAVPIYWQIFALFIRFLLVLSAWWTFGQIWQNRPRLALLAALFTLVFPGYSQHWAAFTHINQELIPLIFYLLSFGFTFKALRASAPLPYVVIALLLQVCGIFPTEYFFGIEGLRFLLLFSVLEGRLLRRLGKTLKIWLPYLLVWILNAAWLVYYYKFGAYASYAITAPQTFTFLDVARDFADAVWKAGFYSWIQILPLALASPTAPASLLTFGLILFSFAFFAPYLKQVAQESREETSPAPALILAGGVGILLGRLPSLAAGLPLTLQSSYDRFMVSMMMGGSLFLLGVIELSLGKSRLKPYVFAVLIAFGVGQQFFNANVFRRDWENQKNIYWQMAWRMPALEPGTLLLTHQMPIDYETDASFTAPINWMYAPDYVRSNLPYLMLYTEKRLGGGALPTLQPNQPVLFNYRTVAFRGNTSQTVVIYMPKDGCLRVLDPAQGDLEIYAKLPRSFTDAIPLSDPSRIIADPSTPVRPMFFSEPRHEWCYYYAKAELALQMGDHKKAIALEKEAASLGYQPADPLEWLVFIRAYALSGDFETARAISAAAIKADPRARRGVCAAWRNLAESAAIPRSEIEGLNSTLQCSP